MPNKTNGAQNPKKPSPPKKEEVGDQGAKPVRPYVVMTDTSRMMDEVRYDLVELTPSLND